MTKYVILICLYAYLELKNNVRGMYHALDDRQSDVCRQQRYYISQMFSNQDWMLWINICMTKYGILICLHGYLELRINVRGMYHALKDRQSDLCR